MSRRYAVVETRPLVAGQPYWTLGLDKRWHRELQAMARHEAVELARLQNAYFRDWQRVKVLEADVAERTVGR